MVRALPLIAAAALLLLSAPAQAAAPFAQATCENKKASLLFWPNGHGRVDGAGFPEYRTPHLEIYGGLHQNTFPSNTNAYAEPERAQITDNACDQVAPKNLSGKVPNSKKREKATNFQCRFGQKMRVVFTAVTGGVKVTIVRKDGTKVIELKVVENGSSATYNKERCEAKPPPD